MISKTNLLTRALGALMIGGMMAASPAKAWTRYHNNAGAVVGAAIDGMDLGATISAATSRSRYYNDVSSDSPPPPGYGNGYSPYGYGY